MLNSNLLDKFKDLEGQSIFSNSNITEKFRKNYLTYLHAVNAVWLYQRRDTVKWYKNPCILLLFHGNNLLIEFSEKSQTINSFLHNRTVLMFISRYRILETLSANLIQIKLIMTISSVLPRLNYVINLLANLLISVNHLQILFHIRMEKSQCRTISQKNDKQFV